MVKALAACMMTALILISGSGCADADPPIHAAKAFLRHLLLGEVDATVSMLSGSDPMAAEKIEKTFGNLPLGEDERIEAEKACADLRFKIGERREDAAVVIVYRQYESDTYTVMLVREEGTWKVDFEGSTFLTAAWSSVADKECHASMNAAAALSTAYASANKGIYPLSWEDLDGYLKERPSCPLDGSQYLVSWSAASPPVFECPNHGAR